jgi:hypothetical protein
MKNAAGDSVRPVSPVRLAAAGARGAGGVAWLRPLDGGAECGTARALVTTNPNAAKIAHDLRAAGGRHTSIVAMNYYDPRLALWLQPSFRLRCARLRCARCGPTLTALSWSLC